MSQEDAMQLLSGGRTGVLGGSDSVGDRKSTCGEGLKSPAYRLISNGNMGSCSREDGDSRAMRKKHL